MKPIARLKPLFALALITALNFSSCKNALPNDSQAAATPFDTTRNDNQLIMAILYQQHAAEYRALCLQCYNLAKLRVDEAINNPTSYKNHLRLAVVTDLDETALDNSGNEAWLYSKDSAYNPKEFDYWCINGKAGAVPGSVAFFRYTDSIKDKLGRKIDIYYISNRTDSVPVIKSTEAQMLDLKFPQIVDSQFLFKASNTPSSKEARRLLVSKTHNIILLLGDNLIDLNKAFDGTTADSTRRRLSVDALAAQWGNKYIVLPNAEYGDWEAALYKNGKYDSLYKEKAMRMQDLKVYPLKTGL